MTERVKSAERLIEQLSEEELSQFATWFTAFQDRLWEKRIGRDSTAGKLDALIERAHRDFDAGRSREM